MSQSNKSLPSHSTRMTDQLYYTYDKLENGDSSFTASKTLKHSLTTHTQNSLNQRENRSAGIIYGALLLYECEFLLFVHSRHCPIQHRPWPAGLDTIPEACRPEHGEA